MDTKPKVDNTDKKDGSSAIGDVVTKIISKRNEYESLIAPEFGINGNLDDSDRKNVDQVFGEIKDCIFNFETLIDKLNQRNRIESEKNNRKYYDFSKSVRGSWVIKGEKVDNSITELYAYGLFNDIITSYKLMSYDKSGVIFIYGCKLPPSLFDNNNVYYCVCIDTDSRYLTVYHSFDDYIMNRADDFTLNMKIKRKDEKWEEMNEHKSIACRPLMINLLLSRDRFPSFDIDGGWGFDLVKVFLHINNRDDKKLFAFCQLLPTGSLLLYEKDPVIDQLNQKKPELSISFQIRLCFSTTAIDHQCEQKKWYCGHMLPEYNSEEGMDHIIDDEADVLNRLSIHKKKKSKGGHKQANIDTTVNGIMKDVLQELVPMAKERIKEEDEKMAKGEKK
jgi:hypothetical protein